jgi:hypothetical protein
MDSLHTYGFLHVSVLIPFPHIQDPELYPFSAQPSSSGTVELIISDPSMVDQFTSTALANVRMAPLSLAHLTQ